MTRLQLRIVAFLFLVSLTVHADSCNDREFGLNEVEFLCDEANARITQCCGQEVGLSCTRSYACHFMSPDLRVSTSLCLREKSCDDIIAAGLCKPLNWGMAYDPSSSSYAALREVSCP